jgi:hypothetical protein
MRLDGTLFAVIWHAGMQPASLSKRSVIMTELPASRKQLSADSLFRNIRQSFQDIPDPRTGKPDINLPDALMSGLAVFAFKDPSLLAFDQRRQQDEENLRTIFHVEHVPCDTRLREILDPVDPEQLRPAFRNVFT